MAKWVLRVFDVVLAGLGLLMLWPLLLVLCVLGWLDTRSPLFMQERVGRHQRPFVLVKLRTMRVGTASVASHLASSSAITPLGALLRRTKLDELPQLWNVLLGDMSLVGPRPLAVHHYERDLAQGNVSRKLLKGGILGMGHIRKGTSEMGDPSFEYEYIDHYIHYPWWRLLALDLWIIWRGIRVVLQGKGL